MSLFNIKLIPKEKEREWELKHITAGRKEKVCQACGKKIPVGARSNTFLKRTSIGAKTDYHTFHTCDLNECVDKVAKQVGMIS